MRQIIRNIIRKSYIINKVDKNFKIKKVKN